MIKKIIKTDLFKNISALTLVQLSNYIIPLLIIPYISRIIGIENYGKLEYARTIVFYFIILVNYGFDLTVTRQIAINRDNQNKLNSIITNTLFTKFLLLVVAVIFFFFFITSKIELRTNSLLFWSTFLITFGYFLFPMWFFQGIEKIASIAIINFIIKLAVLGSVIFFIKEASNYWMYNLFLSIAQVLIGVYTMYVLFKKYNYHITPLKFEYVITSLKDGFSVFFSTILVTIFVSYGFLLLKEFSSNIDVGSYSTANKLAITIQVIVLMPFSQAFFPFISKTANENIYKFEKLIQKAFLSILFLTTTIGFISYFFAEEIILLIFGKDYVSAVATFKILAFLPVFSVLNNLFSYQGLLALKKDSLFLYIHIVFTIIIVIISYLLVPKFGLEAVAKIRLYSEIILMFTSMFFLKITIKKIKNGN